MLRDIQYVTDSNGAERAVQIPIAQWKKFSREFEQMKKKIAQRAQFNPLLPPNYVPPSRGSNWVLWASLAGVAVVVGIILVIALHS